MNNKHPSEIQINQKRLLLVRELIAQPVKSINQSLSIGGGTLDNRPLSIANLGEAKGFGIFAPFKAPGISCLFANTSSVVPFSSSSYSLAANTTPTFRMADSSAFATFRRSISALSTTKITASTG